MKNIFTVSFVGLVLFWAACSKDKNETALPGSLAGSEYFPDDSGLTRIYQADSVYWDEFTGSKGIKSFQIKETIAGYFTDAEGRRTMRIERFKKDSTGNWIIYRVWSAVKTLTVAETQEENKRYVKLRFPASVGTTWNGNVFNTDEAQNYKVTLTGVADQINGLNFTNTLHVEEEDLPPNLLYDKQQETRYAKGIGAYRKFKSDLNFVFISGDTASGYIYTEKLISYSIP